MNAIPYGRVSTGRQEDGLSPEIQRKKITAYCRERAWQVNNHFFTDHGKSGRSTHRRPQLEEAIELACHQRGVLVVLSLSRLARSTIDACTILKQLEEAGSHLAIVDLAIDTTLASGKMIFGLMAVLAEFESNQISERIKAAHDHTMETFGYYKHGRQPAGWRLENGHRVPVPAELSMLDAVRALRPGRTLDQTVDELHRIGVPTLKQLRTGTITPWTELMVRRALKTGKSKNAAGREQGLEEGSSSV